MSPLLAALLTVLVVLVLGAAVIGATLALGAAFGAAFAWAYVPVAAARYERRQRASRAALELPPSARAPYRNREQDPAAAETDAYWQAARHAAQEAAGETPADAGRHAAAMAAVAADAPLPERAAVRVEAVRPLPATKPMPTVDVAAVLPGPVPFAVRYEFDADGARTVVGEQWAGRAA